MIYLFRIHKFQIIFWHYFPEISSGRANTPTRLYEFHDLKQLDSQDFDDYIILQISKPTALSVQYCSADGVATRFHDLIQDSANKFAPWTMRKTSKPKSDK